MNQKTRHFYSFGPFRLDASECLLNLDGKPVPLAPKAFEALLILVENAGHLVDKDDLMRRLWPSTFVEEANVAKYVSLLRNILSEATNGREYIETIPKRGYRFVVEVRETEEVEAGSQPQTLPGASMTGKKVSHYRVLQVLGGGGMGVVYTAEDLRLGRRVALKFLPEELGNDPKAVERFEREARAASALDHPNICSIYEFGEHEGQPFLVMQLLEGQTLRERFGGELQNGKPLPTSELLDLAIQITSGLEAAHQKGIIHRDIKPANIFITEHGEAKILDFGLAKLVPAVTGAGAVPGRDHRDDEALGTPRETLPATSTDLLLSRTGVAMGTAGYMSPEQVRGEVLDVRTDIFSVGVVLYEMATGQRAITGETEPILHDAIVNREAQPLRGATPEISLKLKAIINKCLQKDRERRHQTAAELCAELQNMTSSDGAEHLRRGTKPRALLATFVLLVMGIGVGLYWRAHGTSARAKLTEHDTIVLADFANSTGDTIFDGTLKQALAVQLEQSPFLNVLSDEQVGEWLKLMQRPASERLTPPVTREICLRSNCTALIEGSIARIGGHYLVAAKAVDCSKGNTLASAEKEVKNKDQILDGLEEIGNELRQTLGESLASVEKFNQPLEQATTPSLEALQAFTQGSAIDRDRKFSPLSYYKRALELDPDFPIARSSIGVYYMDSDRHLGIRNIKLAYDLRNRVSQRERFVIEENYYSSIGDLPSLLRNYENWIHTYPRDFRPHLNLGVTYAGVGDFDKAAAEEKEALRLRPTIAITYANLAWFLVKLDHPDEAKLVYDEAVRHGQVAKELPNVRYDIAFLQNDAAALQEQLTSAMKSPHSQYILAEHADTEGYYGRFRSARQFSQSAVRSAENEDDRQSIALFRWLEAQREVEVGNGEPRQKTSRALKLELVLDNNDVVAAIASAGEIAQAERVAAELSREYPLDTIVQRRSLPTIRAAISLKRNNPRRTIEMLETVTPYELGGELQLYPAYLRGQAYLRLGRGQQAAEEFQKLLDHPGIVLNNITGVLAHLQLGRAQVMMGDKAGARKSYNDFLTLWKDADPDIPILRQAKAEYAKLCG